MNQADQLQTQLATQLTQVIDVRTGQIEPRSGQACDCPVCGGHERSLFCIKDCFHHWRCKRCGMVYISPRLSDAATSGFYNSLANELYNAAKFHEPSVWTLTDDLVNLGNLILLLKSIRRSAKGLKLLEIGCGNGFFLQKAQEVGFDVYGIELNGALFEKCRTITDNVTNVDLQRAGFADGMFDAIYMRDVIEHIPMPSDFLKEIHRITAPGGVLLVDTHNIDSLVNSLTKRYHTTIFGLEHPVHWSPRTLTRVCEQVGFSRLLVRLDHSRQSLREILQYYLNPSFTFIRPPRQGRLGQFIARGMVRLLSGKRIGRLDEALMTTLSRAVGRGATMKMLFTRRRPQAPNA